MANVSLYLDEDVRVLLAEILRGRGYDVIHTIEVNRTGKSDEEQLPIPELLRRTLKLVSANPQAFFYNQIVRLSRYK